MSKKNDWGDKIIITLHSDGKRRHKKWCDHYQDDNFCDAHCSNCTGSAHCCNYKNKFEESSSVFYLKENAVSPVTEETKATLNFAWCEYYKLASYGDKLLNKTVMIRNTPYTFKIGEIVEEDFNAFVVKYEGKKHRFLKKIAYRNSSVYVFIGMDKAECTEEL